MASNASKIEKLTADMHALEAQLETLKMKTANKASIPPGVAKLNADIIAMDARAKEARAIMAISPTNIERITASVLAMEVASQKVNVELRHITHAIIHVTQCYAEFCKENPRDHAKGVDYNDSLAQFLLVDGIDPKHFDASCEDSGLQMQRYEDFFGSKYKNWRGIKGRI